MYNLFIIFILTLSTIIFATLFIIYYNNIDKYMKEKENNIMSREKEVTKKEELIKKYEVCNSELTSIKDTINKIRDLIKLI
jgi:hypothetical protein